MADFSPRAHRHVVEGYNPKPKSKKADPEPDAKTGTDGTEEIQEKDCQCKGKTPCQCKGKKPMRESGRLITPDQQQDEARTWLAEEDTLAEARHQPGIEVPPGLRAGSPLIGMCGTCAEYNDQDGVCRFYVNFPTAPAAVCNSYRSEPDDTRVAPNHRDESPLMGDMIPVAPETNPSHMVTESRWDEDVVQAAIDAASAKLAESDVKAHTRRGEHGSVHVRGYVRKSIDAMRANRNSNSLLLPDHHAEVRDTGRDFEVRAFDAKGEHVVGLAKDSGHAADMAIGAQDHLAKVRDAENGAHAAVTKAFATPGTGVTLANGHTLTYHPDTPLPLGGGFHVTNAEGHRVDHGRGYGGYTPGVRGGIGVQDGSMDAAKHYAERAGVQAMKPADTYSPDASPRFEHEDALRAKYDISKDVAWADDQESRAARGRSAFADLAGGMAPGASSGAQFSRDRINAVRSEQDRRSAGGTMHPGARAKAERTAAKMGMSVGALLQEGTDSEADVVQAATLRGRAHEMAPVTGQQIADRMFEADDDVVAVALAAAEERMTETNVKAHVRKGKHGLIQVKAHTDKRHAKMLDQIASDTKQNGASDKYQAEWAARAKNAKAPAALTGDAKALAEDKLSPHDVKGTPEQLTAMSHDINRMADFIRKATQLTVWHNKADRMDKVASELRGRAHEMAPVTGQHIADQMLKRDKPKKPQVGDPVPGAPTHMGAVRDKRPTPEQVKAFKDLETKVMADKAKRPFVFGDTNDPNHISDGAKAAASHAKAAALAMKSEMDKRDAAAASAKKDNSDADAPAAKIGDTVYVNNGGTHEGKPVKVKNIEKDGSLIVSHPNGGNNMLRLKTNNGHDGVAPQYRMSK